MSLMAGIVPYETVLNPEVFRWLSLLISINNLRLVITGLLVGDSAELQQILMGKKMKVFHDFFNEGQNESTKRVKQVSPTDNEPPNYSNSSLGTVIVKLVMFGL